MSTNAPSPSSGSTNPVDDLYQTAEGLVNDLNAAVTNAESVGFHAVEGAQKVAIDSLLATLKGLHATLSGVVGAGKRAVTPS